MTFLDSDKALAGVRVTLLMTAFVMQPGMVKADDDRCSSLQRYTFSWSLDTDCRELSPRGGTTRGTAVTLDSEPHPGWRSLQDESLDSKEKDRRAILAMAGPYRTSFEFLETVGYTPNFERSRPYHSWSTEYVYVVEDSDDFISLQHVIVMFMEGQDGEVQGPFVQKHWRQDWAYEKERLLEYAGHEQWAWRSLSAAEIEGTWAQSVYQVDDSPRYESFGAWQHHGNVSTWHSELTWRPLPRRESSVRDDYHVLEGWNRHTITPDGWVHEEENYKVVLDDEGQPVTDLPYLAKELGVNRYQRIVDFDFSAGNQYWEETEAFWAVVRELWEEYSRQEETFSFREAVEGEPLFAAFFRAAEQWRQAPDEVSALRQQLREEVFERFVIR